jgi:uncharacterized protein
MTQFPSDIAFTASVKAEQQKRGSRGQFKRVEKHGGWPDTITPDLAQFIAGVRSFYLGTASAAGQPYIQHRGGPAGFLKPLGAQVLGFADFGGNRQYITAGNLAENPRAFIFLMDYAKRRRIKLWGTAKIVEDDEKLLTSLSSPSYAAAPERAIVFGLEAWDRNCAQHIPRLLPYEDVADAINQLQRRIAALEAENARLGGAA